MLAAEAYVLLTAECCMSIPGVVSALQSVSG